MTSDVELRRLIETENHPLVRGLASDLLESRQRNQTLTQAMDSTSRAVSVLSAQLQRVQEILTMDYHIVHIQETGFGLQHGFPCRTNLLACPVNRGLFALEEPPAPTGRFYRVSLSKEGRIVIGEEVDPSYDPVVMELKAILGIKG